MKLCIPHQLPERPPYCIKVKWNRLTGEYINKSLGAVAKRPRYARHMECYVHIPGHVTHLAYLVKESK